MKNVERAMQAEPVRRKTDEGVEEVPGEYVYSGSVANKALELLGRELGMFIDRKAAVEQCLRRAAYLPILGATTDQRWTQGEVNPLNTGFALLRCMSPVMALDR